MGRKTRILSDQSDVVGERGIHDHVDDESPDNDIIDGWIVSRLQEVKFTVQEIDQRSVSRLLISWRRAKRQGNR